MVPSLCSLYPSYRIRVAHRSVFQSDILHLLAGLGRKIYIRLVSYYVECRKVNGNEGRGVGASLSLVTIWVEDGGSSLGRHFSVNCLKGKNLLIFYSRIIQLPCLAFSGCVTSRGKPYHSTHFLYFLNHFPCHDCVSRALFSLWRGLCPAL